MVITRFAPSPTGPLHLGHAYAALFAWHAARKAGGRFLLRLEDIDAGRCRPAFSAAILVDLAWLGLDWDGDVRAQSDHLAEYAGVLERLRGERLLYPCFCARADIRGAGGAPQGQAGAAYPGTCRGLDPDLAAARVAEGVPHAWRLDVTAAMRRVTLPLRYEERGAGRVRCRPDRLGDVVLGRKDAPASYHLCVTHDDALQGVTLVTRGIDLQPATDVQRLLQAVLGWPEPAYRHHRVLTDPGGVRLAKRRGSVGLRELGLDAAGVRAAAGFPD